MPKLGSLLDVSNRWLQSRYLEIRRTVDSQKATKLIQNHSSDRFYAGLVEGYPVKLPPSPLCKYCENAFLEFFGNKELSIEVVHNYDFLFTTIPANYDCIVCRRIRERLDYKRPYVPESRGNSVRLVFFRTTESAILLSWVWARKGYNLGEISPTVGHLLQFSPSSSFPRTTEDILPLCKAWLVECTNSHNSCNSREVTRLPTRLICIMNSKVNLIESKNREHLQYATLSHCWGKLSLETLKSDNIAAFKDSIPPSALPKTFQDALRICRYLGLSYLWIDSLCIIQDDPQDWARESSFMTAVYSGSYVNIAASGAKDASMGCFFARESQGKPYIVGPNNEWSYIVQPQDFRERITEAPLSKRAWAMQERFLPPRTIFFTEKEVFWECHERFVSESDPQSVNFHAGFHDFLLRPQNKKQNFSSNLWQMIVHWYTRCELTMSRDKLVAISGMARLFETKMKDTYVAGMWRKDLELQLCWSIEDNEGKERPPGDYIAPSWSWASTIFPVRCSALAPEVESFSSPRIEDLSIQYHSSDHFGQIKSAKLQISCLALLRARIIVTNSQDHSGIAEIEGLIPIHISIFLDWNFTVDLVSDECYILPLTKSKEQEKISCLILMLTRIKKGQYRRLGMCNVWFKDCVTLREGLGKISLQSVAEECVSVRITSIKTRYIIELV